MPVDRRPFYESGEILQAVQKKVRETREMGESIDYLTFVPDGEPTLDIHLGREIESLSSLGIKTAVITNASLIWRKDVREDLRKADWVSLKVDSGEREIWRRMNRPHGRLRLGSILDGIMDFAKSYDGEMNTETMLVEGLNDSPDHARETADFLAMLGPVTACLSIPTRPPAERWVRAPSEGIVSQAYRIFQERMDRVECLIQYEGNAFALTGDVVKDLLGITAVHPMRKDAVRDFLQRGGAHWSLVEDLIAADQLLETEHGGQKFYKRVFGNRVSGKNETPP
jgi:wyosine [tRNA(Phe)-imidazoG37] synthetase (radical SAM superfamily)